VPRPVSPRANTQLRGQRLDRGWSQGRLAQELRRAAGEHGVELPPAATLIPQISRWENRRKDPGEFYRRLLRRIYRASDHNLGFATIVPPRFAAPGAISPQAHAGDQPGLRLAYALSRASRVDAAVIEDVRAVADGLRRLDRRFGALTVADALQALLHQTSQLAQHSMTPEHRRQLLKVVGDVATRLGWLSLDLDRRERSWQFFQTGARAAAEAEDPMLHAFTLAESGYVLLAVDRRTEALARVDAAEVVLGSVKHTTMRAWLTAARAEVLAATSDVEGCRRALDQAHAFLDHPDSGASPAPYVDYLDGAHLRRWTGSCLASLGHPEAASAVEEALVEVDPSFVRARAGLVIDLATAHSAAGDLDRACISAAEGVRLAAETRSARQVRRVVGLRERLRPAAGTPAYADLLNQLGDALDPEST
jgi:tetratricopeptide (TPR) repeat protein